MRNGEEHIDFDKLTAYIAGEGSVEERKAIQDWIDASEDNRKTYEQYKQVFQLDYTLDRDLENSTEETAIFNTDRAWDKVAETAGLTKEDSSTIKLPVDPPHAQNRKNYFSPWLKIAASLFIGITLLFYFINQQNAKMTEVSFDTGVHEFLLPDSTRVVMKGASGISFDKNFNQGHRILQLNGMAYFDVVRNEKIPFTIDTKYGQVIVLGTAFSVEEKENSVTVEVERGKVSLGSLGSEIASPLILQQSEKGILDIEKNALSKSKLSSLNHLYWANRKLTYRQAPLQLVLEELAMIFEKKFLFNPDAITDCRVSAVFNDQKFEDILQNISVVLNFDYFITEDQIEIISNGCNAN